MKLHDITFIIIHRPIARIYSLPSRALKVQTSREGGGGYDMPSSENFGLLIAKKRYFQHFEKGSEEKLIL